MIDIRSLRPLDTETIVNSVKKTNRLVTVEEGWAFSLATRRDRARVERIEELAPSCRVVNHYGPTETTVSATLPGLIAAARPMQ